MRNFWQEREKGLHRQIDLEVEEGIVTISETLWSKCSDFESEIEMKKETFDQLISWYRKQESEPVKPVFDAMKLAEEFSTK